MKAGNLNVGGYYLGFKSLNQSGSHSKLFQLPVSLILNVTTKD